jgi:protein phosphatase 1 regulatory subunit 7
LNLPKLRILSIQSNRIEELLGLEHLFSLEELYVSHNKLKKLQPLLLQRLRILDICHNSIGSLREVSLSNEGNGLRCLEELWASGNCISDIKELDAIPKTVQCVYLDGNGLPEQYKTKLRWMMPGLKQIDHETLSG